MVHFLIILGIFLLFWVIFGYICFRSAFMRRKSDFEEKETLCGGGDVPCDIERSVRAARAWLDGMGGEDIYIKGRDGVRLYGRLIRHSEPSLGIVIFTHGYHSSCRRDLAVQIKGVYTGGYDVLLVSQRAHGKSGGKYLTFGAKERYDILLWSEYIASRFRSTPIALMGLSMGGATVMNASALPLPEDVRCIVSDCGFTSPFEITVNTLRHRKHIIPYPTVFFIDLWCMLIAHFKLTDAKAYKALKQNTRPLLIFHGELDTYVPTYMSKRNAAITPSLTELVIVPHAKHSQSVYYDPDGYLNKLLDFLNVNMSLK